MDCHRQIIVGVVGCYKSYSYKSTSPKIGDRHLRGLGCLLTLKRVSSPRQYTGMCDITSNYALIRENLSGLDGFLLNCGRGAYDFEAVSISGKMIAELIDTGEAPDLIKSFSLARFRNGRLVKEKGRHPQRRRVETIGPQIRMMWRVPATLALRIGTTSHSQQSPSNMPMRDAMPLSRCIGVES